MAADVQIERHRFGAQQMVVDRRDFEAARLQLADHGIDLAAQQDQIAHDHRTIMHRLERRPAAKRQTGLDSDIIDLHLQVGPRKAIAVDVARDGRASADGRIDLLPVDALGMGGSCHGCASTDRQYKFY